ncbi:DUF6288 domain-containing protein [bacterium]|nr:DUF6288 domain-containing protein [bacterium]
MSKNRFADLKSFSCFILIVLALVTPLETMNAQHSNSAPRPDLTAGDAAPEGWTHDWNLGPTGARGWIYCDKHVTTDARQILVTEVATGSPADGKLKVGDVITGIFGFNIVDDARVVLVKRSPQRKATKSSVACP